METNEITTQIVLNLKDGSVIVKLAAVVGGGEHGHELAVGIELVTILDNLMCTADQVYLVSLAEGGHHVLVELVADSAVVV